MDAQLIIAIDPTRLAIAVAPSESSRILSAMEWSPRSTRLQPNVFRLDAVAHRDPCRQRVEQIGVAGVLVHIGHRYRVVVLCKSLRRTSSHGRKSPVWRCPSRLPHKAYAGVVTPSDASGYKPPDLPKLNDTVIVAAFETDGVVQLMCRGWFTGTDAPVPPTGALIACAPG